MSHNTEITPLYKNGKILSHDSDTKIFACGSAYVKL